MWLYCYDTDINGDKFSPLFLWSRYQVHSNVTDDMDGAPWWRHQMETFSALLAFCAGYSPFPVEFPAQRPVTRSFDVFVDLRPNKRLNKQWWGWWLETLSRPLWRHCNAHAVPLMTYLYFGPLFNHSNRDITSSSWADRVAVPERKYVIKIRVRYQYSRWRRKQLLRNVYTAIFIFCMVVFHSTEARYSGAIITSVWYANLWQNLTKLP